MPWFGPIGIVITWQLYFCLYCRQLWVGDRVDVCVYPVGDTAQLLTFPPLGRDHCLTHRTVLWLWGNHPVISCQQSSRWQGKNTLLKNRFSFLNALLNFVQCCVCFWSVWKEKRINKTCQCQKKILGFFLPAMSMSLAGHYWLRRQNMLKLLLNYTVVQWEIISLGEFLIGQNWQNLVLIFNVLFGWQLALLWC